MSDDLRLICLTKRWQHHATGSGYDRLVDFLSARTIRRRDPLSFSAIVVRKLWSLRYYSPSYLLDYRLDDRMAEERAFWLALALRAQIIHVLYGDEQLDILLRRARLLPGHLVATFHLPAERTRERFERIQTRELRRLSGAVVLASREVPQFARWLGAEKVMYVPHGIDLSAFKVGEGSDRGPLQLLFVGEHMRDFELAHRVADRCALEDVDVKFTAVLRPHLGHFNGCDNVQQHHRISDDALISHYQRADALFLPVQGATANNSVLESLACGTPVISTRIGGISDYVDDSCGWLLPLGDVEAAFALVKFLANNRACARVKRLGARAQAEKFSWELVAAQIMSGYRRLADGGCFSA